MREGAEHEAFGRSDSHRGHREEREAAVVEGKESIACALGYKSKAKGEKGCWIVLAEKDEEYNILDVKAVKVDGKTIKADTFYTLENGEFVEAENEQR